MTREEMIARERAESIKMMSSPLNWPRYPLLPVKKRNPESWPTCGLMVTGNLTTVYEDGLSLIPPTDNIHEYLEEHSAKIHRFRKPGRAS